MLQHPLPLLGEPPVVEFANTLYVSPEDVVDFLATTELARRWFGACSPSILDDVESLDEPQRRHLVEVRDAIRVLFDATGSNGTRVAGTRTLGPALTVLEAAVNTTPGRIELTIDAEHGLQRRIIHDTATAAGTAAMLALAAIDIATSATPVRICSRPACSMRYLRHHGRRRYCNSACANADRQARFQRRTTDRESRTR